MIGCVRVARAQKDGSALRLLVYGYVALVPRFLAELGVFFDLFSFLWTFYFISVCKTVYVLMFFLSFWSGSRDSDAAQASGL